MDIKKVWAVYFSPTGGTEKYALALSKGISEFLGVPFEEYDFTLPAARERKLVFGEGDVVVLASCVYAGRVPNKLLDFVQNGFEGNGAIGVPVAVYGNRSVDNGLMELKVEMENNGFKVAAGAAFVSAHVMSEVMAAGRPDEEDISFAAEFGKTVAKKLESVKEITDVEVVGENPIPAYYTPLDENGKPAKFLKAKPKTDSDKCVKCGLCARVCPMGSVNKEDVSVVDGVCIKCQACVKRCPKGAKYFDDPIMLSHIKMLESNYAARKENMTFI